MRKQGDDTWILVYPENAREICNHIFLLVLFALSKLGLEFYSVIASCYFHQALSELFFMCVGLCEIAPGSLPAEPLWEGTDTWHTVSSGEPLMGVFANQDPYMAFNFTGGVQNDRHTY